jgi:hypothetical protein
MGHLPLVGVDLNDAKKFDAECPRLLVSPEQRRTT